MAGNYQYGRKGPENPLQGAFERAKQQGSGIEPGANKAAANTHVGLDMPDVGGFLKKVGKAIGFSNPFGHPSEIQEDHNVKPIGKSGLNSSGNNTSPSTSKDS